MQIILETLKCFRLFRIRVICHPLLGCAGRELEELGFEIQQALNLIADEGNDFINCFSILKNVDFIDDHDDFFAPLTNVFQEFAFTLCEGTICRSDEDDHIAAGDELSHDGFMMAHDGICARCVNDVDLTQDLRWITHDAYVIADELRISWLAMFYDVYPIRRRCYTFFKESLSKQGVDERGFPAVKFTDDDEQEEFVELIESMM